MENTSQSKVNNFFPPIWFLPDTLKFQVLYSSLIYFESIFLFGMISGHSFIHLCMDNAVFIEITLSSCVFLSSLFYVNWP